VEVVGGFVVVADWNPLKSWVVGFAVVVGGAVEDHGSEPNPARPPLAFVLPDAHGFANDEEAGTEG
jgi:hypothetical protein